MKNTICRKDLEALGFKTHQATTIIRQVIEEIIGVPLSQEE